MEEPQVSKKITRRQLLISSGVAITILVSGFIAWWSLYYNSPDRILASALQKLSAAESTGYDGTFTAGGLALTFNGEANNSTNAAQAQLTLGTFTLKAQIKSDPQATYVQLQEPKETIQKLLAVPALAPYATQLTVAANKLEGKWLRITDETKVVDSSCTNLLTGSSLSSQQRAQLTDLFRQHTFVQIGEKLGTEAIRGQASWHYTLRFDHHKAKEFNKELLKIEPFKSSQKCLSTGLPMADNKLFESLSEADIHIWIAEQSHELTKLTAKLSDKNASMNLTLFLDLGKEVNNTMPTADTVSLKDLLETIKKGR